MAEAHSTPRKLFIVGASRSGTSAFARLMGRHGKIVMGVERYIKAPVEDWNDRLWTREVFFGDDYENKHTDGPHYAEQARKFDQAEWIGDKVPAWIGKVDELRAAFPGCTILCLLREPRDIGFSFERKGQSATKGFWQGKGFEHGVKAAARAYKLARQIIEAGTPDFYMVEYDRVFGGDADYLKAILAVLDLTPDESILSSFEASSRKGAEIAARPRPLDDDKQAALDDTIPAGLIDFLRAHSVEHATSAVAA